MALVSAGWAAWLQVPRPPSLNGERLFKTLLVTLFRGQVEQGSQSVEEWENLARRFAPFHPAGRMPEDKLLNPAAVHLPGARLEGEQALIDALTGLPDLPSRYARMYEQDEGAFESLMGDPADLGSEYDPMACRMGLDWDDVAALGGGRDEVLVTALEKLRARWVWVRSDDQFGPSLADAFEAILPELMCVESGPVDEIETLAEALRNGVEARDDRRILVAEGSAVLRILRMLHQCSDLRDLVSGVVSIGAPLAGVPTGIGLTSEGRVEDWMEGCFTQEQMNTEVVRLNPYFSVQWIERGSPMPGARGLPLGSQRFPEPKADVSTRTVEVVDLGVLPDREDLPLEQVSRALVLAVAQWTVARNP